MLFQEHYFLGLNVFPDMYLILVFTSPHWFILVIGSISYY